uniref:histidine kinase n=1 Tax=Prevotella sp. GTC17253 TaxID=3236793 RepID=A0AB33IMP2_9BACT
MKALPPLLELRDSLPEQEMPLQTGLYLYTGNRNSLPIRGDHAIVIGSLTTGVICVLSASYIFIYRHFLCLEKTLLEKEKCIQEHRILLETHKKIILSVSHDIRSPLNVISGSAELAMSACSKEEHDRHLANIRERCLHILHLLNGLLDIYRLKEEKATVNAIPFRLSDLLDRIVVSAEQMAGDRGLHFTHTFRHTDVTLKGDSDRIEEIIDNLLTNAMKYTRRGKVDLHASYSKGKLQVEIRDTGIGMDKKMMERIFIPFERCDNNRKVEGYGLGLTITQGLVSLMGGRISVTSRLGKGSSFKVSLPLSKTSIPVDNGMAGADCPLNLPHRVLVIDDDPLQLEIVREMLERNGVSCTACNNALDFSVAMRKQDYDVLLTDIHMSGTDGFSLLELLRKSNLQNSRQLPVIAMSARGDFSREDIMARGFSGCVFKPFSSNELLRCLSSAAQHTCCADFTPLTRGTTDKCGILQKLIASSRKDIADLKRAMKEADREALREIVHRIRPLWELMRRECKLQYYHEMLKGIGTDSNTVNTCTENIIIEIRKLIADTEKELERIRHEKENTDS